MCKRPRSPPGAGGGGMTPEVGVGEGGRLCLPPAAWPAPDRACWAVATCPGDLLLDDGSAAHLKPGSLRITLDADGRWLGCRRGRLDPDAFPSCPGHPGGVAAYVAELQRVNAPLTVLGRIADLATVLRWFAPEPDWSWLPRSRPGCVVGSARHPKTASAPAAQRARAVGPRAAADGYAARPRLSRRRRARRIVTD